MLRGFADRSSWIAASRCAAPDPAARQADSAVAAPAIALIAGPTAVDPIAADHLTAIAAATRAKAVPSASASLRLRGAATPAASAAQNSVAAAWLADPPAPAGDGRDVPAFAALHRFLFDVDRRCRDCWASWPSRRSSSRYRVPDRTGFRGRAHCPYWRRRLLRHRPGVPWLLESGGRSLRRAGGIAARAVRREAHPSNPGLSIFRTRLSSLRRPYPCPSRSFRIPRSRRSVRGCASARRANWPG